MKQIVSILMFAAFIQLARAESPSPARVTVAAPQTAVIERKADKHGIGRSEALAKYREMFDSDSITALHAVEFFGKRNAFDVLALALPALPRGVRSFAIETL